MILMAPMGDKALVHIVNDLFVVTVPPVAGRTESISVANPDNASFPATKITDIGAQFPTWGDDGRTVHWSIGRPTSRTTSTRRMQAQRMKSKPNRQRTNRSTS